MDNLCTKVHSTKYINGLRINCLQLIDLAIFKVDITSSNDYRFVNNKILFSLNDFGLRIKDKFDSYCGIAKSIGSGIHLSTDDIVVPLKIDTSDNTVKYAGSQEFTAFFGTELNIFLSVSTI